MVKTDCGMESLFCLRSFIESIPGAAVMEEKVSIIQEYKKV